MTRWIISLVVALLLTGCNPSELVRKISNPEKVKVAEDYFARLKNGELEKLAEEVDDSLKSNQLPDQLKAMRALMPTEPITSTELVGYQWHTTHSLGGERESTYSVTHQIRHGDKWLLAFIGWREKDGVRRITAFRVVPMEKSLQETHAFSLWDTDLVRAAFLAGAVAVVVFILVTLVACIRTRISRHKWLWIVFILFGFTQVSINWTTGVVSFSPIAIQLLGVSAFAQPFSAWIISISLPAGAIAFWIRRPALRAAAAEPPVIQKAES